MESNSRAADQLELGRLYCDKGDFRKALEILSLAADAYEKEKRFDEFLKASNLILRILAEMEDLKGINQLKERLQDLVIRENVVLSAKTFYTLGLCACYKGQNRVAFEYMEKSLASALAEDHKEDICFAINGLAILYYNVGRLDDALKEIHNLQVFFQVLELPELQLSSQLLNGMVLRKLGQHEKALELLWQAYDSLRSLKNLYMYVSLLFAMGKTYAEMGEKNLARMYLTLADRSVDPESHRRCARLVREELDLLIGDQESQYDIIFEGSKNSVVEKKKGRVDFKNQFILLDLLRLFIKHPGEVYSKENLVERIWKQEYDPMVHDNKIYVTIKRLRKLIEPDFDKPKYIFRAKNGYYLSKSTRVLLNN